VLGTNHQCTPESAPESEEGSLDMKVLDSVINTDSEDFATEERLNRIDKIIWRCSDDVQGYAANPSFWAESINRDQAFKRLLEAQTWPE